MKVLDELADTKVVRQSELTIEQCVGMVWRGQGIGSRGLRGEEIARAMWNG